MKTVFRISILINLVLLGIVICLSVERNPAVSRIVAVAEVGTPATGITAPAPETLPSSRPESFHWGQLESADYQTYISNLRGIGCPEQTIRDLITADVDAGIFAPQREQLEQKQTTTAGGAAMAVLTRQKADARLHELHVEEVAMVETLLGQQIPFSEASTNTRALSRTARASSKEAPIAMPLIFQNVDLSALKLDTNQINVIAGLRQKFLSEIGGPDQDPNDPAYRERWQKAQATINGRLQGMIGLSAFHAYEQQARLASASAANASRKP